MNIALITKGIGCLVIGILCVVIPAAMTFCASEGHDIVGPILTFFTVLEALVITYTLFVMF